MCRKGSGHRDALVALKVVRRFRLCQEKCGAQETSDPAPRVVPRMGYSRWSLWRKRPGTFVLDWTARRDRRRSSETSDWRRRTTDATRTTAGRASPRASPHSERLRSRRAAPRRRRNCGNEIGTCPSSRIRCRSLASLTISTPHSRSWWGALGWRGFPPWLSIGEVF